MHFVRYVGRDLYSTKTLCQHDIYCHANCCYANERDRRRSAHESHVQKRHRLCYLLRLMIGLYAFSIINVDLGFNPAYISPQFYTAYLRRPRSGEIWIALYHTESKTLKPINCRWLHAKARRSLRMDGWNRSLRRRDSLLKQTFMVYIRSNPGFPGLVT